MDVGNVVMFYLVIISDTTNKFFPGDNKDLMNYWTELNWTGMSHQRKASGGTLLRLLRWIPYHKANERFCEEDR